MNQPSNPPPAPPPPGILITIAASHVLRSIAVCRPVEMGVSPNQISDSLAELVAQRLIDADASGWTLTARGLEVLDVLDDAIEYPAAETDDADDAIDPRVRSLFELCVCGRDRGDHAADAPHGCEEATCARFQVAGEGEQEPPRAVVVVLEKARERRAKKIGGKLTAKRQGAPCEKGK